MSSAITLDGQTRINELAGSEQPLVIDRMVLALIPELDYTAAVDRSQQMPDGANIVHTYDIPAGFSGYINPDQVVYSMILGSDIGNFSFNWIGAIESATGTVICIMTTPEIQKRKTVAASNITGNNITRNMMLQYRDAQQISAITVPAETWQIDFTVRLNAIDERERQSNRDIYGRAVFWGDAAKVVNDGTYKVQPGIVYIEGVRINISAEQAIVYSELPADMWIDVFLQKNGSDVTAVFSFTGGSGLTDYTDANGYKHYVVRIATINEDGTITDLRATEDIGTDLITWLVGVKAPKVISADHTAQNGERLMIDTSAGPVPVTVPENPADNARVSFSDFAKTWDKNTFTLKRAVSGEKIQGREEDMNVTDKGASFDVIFKAGTTQGWVIV